MEDKSVSRKKKRDALTPSICEIPDCGYTKFFQRHRIVPGRDGGKYKLGNVIALCPNHHAEADAGQWDPEYLAEIVRRRVEADGELIIEEAPGGATSDPAEGCHPSEEPDPCDGDGSGDALDGAGSG